MPSWLVKTAIHRFISFLPQSQKWNEWFQTHITKSLKLSPGAFEKRLEFTHHYLNYFQELRPECANGFTALELGTGWYPTVPIGLYLCGAREIWSFDIEPLLRRERLETVVNYFLEYERLGKLQEFLPVPKPDRIAKLREVLTLLKSKTPAEALETLNIHAVIRDARETGLPPRSIDLFFSCVVLEHIPAFIQEGLYTEFRRIGSVGSVMISYIGVGDQFAVFDRSISPLNFLKYSSAQWKWLDSPLTPQNRMRISDHRAVLSRCGYQIKKEVLTRALASELERITIAPEFRKYSQEDLLVVYAWIVAQAPAS